MAPEKDFLKLQKEELNISDVVKLVKSPKCGAISTFIGTTRDNFENKKVVKLEYEAYEPMALKVMTNICSEVRSQWNVEKIAIYHRLGEVPISEESVIIAISSPHRQESLKAVEYTIDKLKAQVPIWKKEIYADEESCWKENKECTWANISIKEEVEIKQDAPVSPAEKPIDTDINIDEAEEEKEIVIDPNLVQIHASTEELNHRIESFIARKRQQVNIVNVQEFCCHREYEEENNDLCARVNAILIRRKDSKSHVKVHRVLNAWGPQTVDQTSLRKTTMSTANPAGNISSSVLDDRISTSERILGITKPVPRDVYERLKNIEDRILFLEGISPEYKDLWVADDIHNLRGTFKVSRKRTYSTAELDSKLQELEYKYVKKMK